MPLLDLPPNTDQTSDGRLRVRVYVAGTTKSTRFPLDAETRTTQRVSPALTKKIAHWITKTKGAVVEQHRVYGEAAPAPRGRRHRASVCFTLDVDAPRFLRQIEGRASAKADRSHLRACCDCAIALVPNGPVVRVGSLRRDQITTEVVNLMMAAWQRAPQGGGVRVVRVQAYARDGATMPAYERTRPVTSGEIAAPRTIRHRVRVLSELYTTLDGVDAPNPVTHAKRPRTPKATPVGVEASIILQVARALAQAAQPRQRVRAPRDAAAYAQREAQRQRERLLTYVRFVVLVTTGQRPAQLMRAEPTDVHLDTKTWLVRAAKGAPPHTITLTMPMVQAWQAFIAVDAWGAYSTTLHGNRVHAAGWPEGIRPYNARHALAIDALTDFGIDLSDVQGMHGHTTPATTRFYAPIALGRQRQVSDKLEGRLAELFTLKAVK
jgi:integrase